MKIVPHISLLNIFIFFTSLLSAQVAEMPTVTIVSSDVAFCEEGTATVEVEFTGEPPFGLYYEVDGSYHTVGVNESTGSLLIDSYSASFDVTQNTSADVVIVRVYDNNYGIDPLNHTTKLNSGSDLVNGSVSITIDSKPTPNAGIDDEVCGYEYTLQGSVSDASHTIYWNDMTGVGTYSDINSPTSTFTKSEEGQATFILTEKNGACSETDEVTLDFHGSPTAVLNSPGEYKFCTTDTDPDEVTFSVDFSGNAPFDYVIKNNTNSYSENSTVLTDNVGYPVSSSDQFYIFSVSDVNGCAAEEKDIIGTQIVTDLKPEVSAGSDDVACGTEYVLQASLASGNTGVWTSDVGDIFDDTSNKNATASLNSYTLAQDVAFTWTEKESIMGCSDVDEVVITYAEPPALELLNTEDQICTGSSTYLNLNITNGNEPFSVLYNDESDSYSKTDLAKGNNTLELNPTFDITSSVQSQTDFHFTKISGVYGCTTSYSDLIYNVYVDEQPAANAGIDQLDLCDREITLDATPSVGDGYWSPDSDGQFEDVSDSYTTFTAYDSKEYTLTWNEINGQCSSSDDVIVSVQPSPYPVEAGVDSTIYAMDNFQLYAETLDEGEGIWSLLEGNATINNPKDPTSIVTDMKPGVYRFQWSVIPTEASICDPVTDEVVIIIKELFETGGFSPNGDAINEEFKIPGSENLHNIKFVVFDKYGKLVHEESYSENVRITWNGEGLDGEDLTEGVYYYIFDADELSKPVKKYLVIKR